eukprot:COSAG01_NODE_549_length_15608_cov_206.443355_2_plen_186_part_00
MHVSSYSPVTAAAPQGARCAPVQPNNTHEGVYHVCELRIRVHSAVARIFVLLNIDGLHLVIEIWMVFNVWVWTRWISQRLQNYGGRRPRSRDLGRRPRTAWGPSAGFIKLNHVLIGVIRHRRRFAVDDAGRVDDALATVWRCQNLRSCAPMAVIAQHMPTIVVFYTPLYFWGKVKCLGTSKNPNS